MNVAVVGGGVIGCTAAFALAERGARVCVFERTALGAEASSAAAGILGAQVELHGRQEDAADFVRAREAWQEWARSLRERTGIDVGHRVTGVLRIARSREEAVDLEREVAWQRARGLRAELLDGPAARRIEPELADGLVAAAHFPDDAQVDPPAVMRALAVALAGSPGVSVTTGVVVEALLVERDRCVGVRVGGAEVRADATVLAAGSWSSTIGGVPASIPPVKPVRGQMAMLEERPPRLRTIVFGGGGYVVPRGDGRVVVGSTMENAGFRREVTAAGLHAILSSALACAPALGAAEVVRTWSSFRPRAGEGQLVVGASTLPGLFAATGHHRNGILLSRTTAVAIAQAVLGASK